MSAAANDSMPARVHHHLPRATASTRAAPTRVDLGRANRNFEIDGDLDPALWHEWLWGTDPEEPFHMDVLFNRNQLIGLLVCRYKHADGSMRMTTGGRAGVPEMDRMVIMDKSVHEMTWRELKDTVANMMFEWPTYVERIRKTIRFANGVNRVRLLVDACAASFGELIQAAWSKSVLDDTSDTQPHGSDASMVTITPAAARRMIGGFLIMYRHIYLMGNSTRAPRWNNPLPVTKYNYESSMDQFNLLSMHISLPVGARLIYRHDFPGMYNHVSQVAFFHNSTYASVPRAPLDEIESAPPAHILPALMELYPNIKLRYEEDHLDPTRPAGWYWLLIAGRVYLVSPEPRVYHSERVVDLLGVYIPA